MSDSSAPEPDSASELFDAIAQGNTTRIAELLPPMSFTLFDVSEDPDSEELDTLTAQVDDFDVLVAFSSDDHAGMFAGVVPDLFETDDDIPAFIVDGGTLISNVPEGCGVLLNPETDDCYVLSPDMVAAVVGQMNRQQ